MNIYKYDIVFQEVPEHIALAFYVCGCPLKCEGCHSPELWNLQSGFTLTPTLFLELLERYQGKADCVLFMGGEWHHGELIGFLQKAQQLQYKTALYTGLDQIPTDLKSNLDFLKTGPWKKELGGLNSPSTNQIFMDLTNNKVLNHLFQY